jgi:hypothetical protein
MHDHLKFQKLRAKWVLKGTEGLIENVPNDSVLATSLIMQMKEKTFKRLTGLLWETNHECNTT